MNKKANGVEFLMTYGCAILVVLIAIGALGYFGVLSPNFSEKFVNKCSCSYAGYEGYVKVVENGVTYYECYNVTKYLDFDERRIKFNSTHKLFYCDEDIKEFVEVKFNMIRIPSKPSKNIILPPKGIV